NYSSFTKAAAELHVSQPALSQQIKHLEAQLGAVLFDRSGRQVRTTDAGAVYRRYAQEAVKALQEGESMLHNEDALAHGRLSVAATPTLASSLVGLSVSRFHARHPQSTVQVRELDEQRMERQLFDDQ